MNAEQRAEAQKVMDGLMNDCTYLEGIGDYESRYFVNAAIAQAYRFLSDLLDAPAQGQAT